MDCVVEAVRLYDVKHLLIDARNTVVDVADSLYAEIVGAFVQDLMQTRLQKIARLATQSGLREKQLYDVRTATKISIAFKNFQQTEEALEWLEAEF